MTVTPDLFRGPRRLRVSGKSLERFRCLPAGPGTRPG